MLHFVERLCVVDGEEKGVELASFVVSHAPRTRGKNKWALAPLKHRYTKLRPIVRGETAHEIIFTTQRNVNSCAREGAQIKCVHVF